MASVNTNAAAITALRTLQQTNNQLDATQGRISTGLKIGEAKDNAAYWAISTTLKSDNKSLATVKDALGLGSATVDVAYQGLNKTKDVLDEIKAKLTAATQPGVDRNVIQAEIGELQKQLVSIAGSSVFSGENWLSVDSSAVDYDATKKIVASFARDSNNSVAIGTVDVAIGGVALFDSSTVAGKNGILDNMQLLKDKNGVVLSVGGTADTSGNTNAAGLATAATGVAINGTVGGAGGNNLLVGSTGAVAGTAAAGTAGAADTRARAVFTAAANYSTSAGQTGDTFTFNITIDSGSAVAITTGALADSTIGDAVSKLQAAINTSSIGAGKILVADTGGKLTFTSVDAASQNGTSSAVKIDSWANSTPARTGGVTNGASAGSTANGTGTPASSGSLTRAVGALTGLAAGDTIEVSYKLGASATVNTAILTVPVGGITTAAQFATAWGSATGTNGVTVSNPSGTNLLFTDAGTTGTGSNFTLTDAIVKSSTGVIKNVDVIGGGFNESIATKVTTGTLTWTGLTATDTVTLGLNNGAGAVGPVTVAAGSSVADFANNLNANATFSAAFRASEDTGKLVITKATTGVAAVPASGGTFGITAVSFATAAGAAKAVTTTGFGHLATAPTATTGTFSTFTLDGNDTLDLSIQVGTGTAKKVSIDQALVNSTLGPAAAGTVATNADFKRVVDAALAKSGVTGVSTTDNGTTLTFNGTLGQSLTISGGTASQGAQTMSVATMDISDAGLLAKGVDTGDEIAAVLSSYITVVNNAINSVTTAAANLGAVASRIDMQKSFVNTLMDTIDKGVGGLIDADMSEESTKLQALQVKQQLGVQALSIANQSSQNILRLFQ